MANDKNNRQLVVFGAPNGGGGGNATWGSITGVISTQTDLMTELGKKANTSALATVATSGSYTDLTNTPTIPDAVSGTNDGTNWTTLTIGSVTKNIPSGGGAAQIQSDWTQNDNTKVDYIKNKPSLATVATSGSYNDLSNTPSIPDAVSGVNDNTNWTSLTIGSVTKGIPAAQVNADWNSSTGVSQILNKPTMTTETLTFIDTNNVETTVIVYTQPTV